MENPIKMNDLGVSLFQETTISPYLCWKRVALSPALQSQPRSATAVAPPSVAATEVLSQLPVDC